MASGTNDLSNRWWRNLADLAGTSDRRRFHRLSRTSDASLFPMLQTMADIAVATCYGNGCRATPRRRIGWRFK
jgi:hypothetical protein